MCYKERSLEMGLRRSWYEIRFLFYSLESSKKTIYGSKFEKSKELLVVSKYFLVLNHVK